MKTLLVILMLASATPAPPADPVGLPRFNTPSAIGHSRSEIPTQCPGGVCPPRFYSQPPQAARGWRQPRLAPAPRLDDDAFDAPSGAIAVVPQLSSAERNAIVRVQSGTSLGSGVLVFADDGTGVVVTARHVVEPFTGRVIVTFGDGRRVQSETVTRDKEGSDLAAAVVELPAGIQAVDVGNLPSRGEWVLACGYGSGQFAAQPNRVIGFVTYAAEGDGIELQGTVRSGDSGGPVFNARGQVVAIVNASSQPGAAGQENMGTQCGPIRAFLGRIRQSFKALFGKRRGGSNAAPQDPVAPSASGAPVPAPEQLGPLLDGLEKLRAGNQAILDSLQKSGGTTAGLAAKLDTLSGGVGTLHQQLGTLQEGLGQNLDSLHDKVADVGKLLGNVGPQLEALVPQLGAAARVAAPGVGSIPGLGPGLSIALYVLGGLAVGGGGLKLWQQLSPAPVKAAGGARSLNDSLALPLNDGPTLAAIRQQLQQLLAAQGSLPAAVSSLPADASSSSIANPPSQIANQPVVVATQSAPPPQSVVNTQSFVPVSVDRHQQAYQWASQQMASKYPGTVQNIESLNSLIAQYLAAQPQS